MPLGVLWNTQEEQKWVFFKKVFFEPCLSQVSEEQLKTIFSIFNKNAHRFSQFIFSDLPVDPKGFLERLSQESKIPTINREDLFAHQIDTEKLSYTAMKELVIIPIKSNEEEVVLVTANPFVSEVIYEVNSVLNSSKNFTIYLCHPADILIYLEKFFQTDHAEKALFELRYLFPNDSAWQTLTKAQSNFFLAVFSAMILFLVFFHQRVFEWALFISNLMYLPINPFRIFVASKGFQEGTTLEISEKDVKQADPDSLPLYSILIPLYKESRILPKLVEHLKKLDYPISKLEIKILLEEDDTETIAAARAMGLFFESDQPYKPGQMNEYFEQSIEAIVCPKADVKTKPRACNYAFQKTLGEFCVIYDAEDRPEPDQLKKAVLGFRRSSKDVICIQSKLSYYNSRQNWLTRYFALEYLYWFDYYLPGLDRVGAPIPLGGTSNHFRSSWLRMIGAWDPYNVTEDADLGMRIYKRNKKIALINSYTYEEAVSKFQNWFRQRSRWQKGYIQTYLVHMRRPIYLFKKLGLKKFLYFQAVIGGNVFVVLVNPILWLGLLISLFTPFDYFFMNTPAIAILCFFNLIIGNLTYIGLHVMAVFKSKKLDLLPWALTIPIYWIFISLGAWKGLLQLITKPHYWEKTEHGFAKEDIEKLAVANIEPAATSQRLTA